MDLEERRHLVLCSRAQHSSEKSKGRWLAKLGAEMDNANAFNCTNIKLLKDAMNEIILKKTSKE